MFQSDDTRPFLTAGSGVWSRRDLWLRAQDAARVRLSAVHSDEPNVRVPVSTDSVVDFVVQLIGSAMAGEVPVLGRPGMWAGLDHASLGATVAGEHLSFSTSGSTGVPSLWPKSWTVVRREADFWVRELALGADDVVFSLVQPFHIYGFLHAFLVPWISGSSVTVADGGLAGIDEAAMLRADVVVGVPAVWPLLEKVLKGGRGRWILSSGAPLGLDRVDACGGIFRQRGDVPRFLEILGSTETGGIGWRDVTEGGDPAYRTVPGVTILFDEEPLAIRSPFLFPDGSRVELADRLIPDGLSGFRHEGRADRVFKYGAKRYSLVEVEQAVRGVLGEHSGVADVKVFFRENPSLSKGGELLAFAVTRDISYADFRRSFVTSHGNLPCPHRLWCMKSLGDDASGGMGKVTLAGLLAQVGAA